MNQTSSNVIDRNSTVSDIVNADYRTADIFRKYGIEFCCGGRRSLESACEVKSLDTALVQKELEDAIQVVYLPNALNFSEWDTDFLATYIVNVHHEYLKKSLPPAKEYLARFAEGHEKKYPYVISLMETFNALVDSTLPHLAEEEEIIFPYISQITHAYNNREPYARLLVRTLRKPIQSIMHSEHSSVGNSLSTIRELSNNYTPPENACLNHKVTFLKLKEIDNDLVQHMYLENSILFPRAIGMEKELLKLS